MFVMYSLELAPYPQVVTMHLHTVQDGYKVDKAKEEVKTATTAPDSDGRRS